MKLFPEFEIHHSYHKPVLSTPILLDWTKGWKLHECNASDASDAISLSDDDFEDDLSPTLTKRKFEEDGFTKCPKPKKRKLSYSQSENYFNLTKVQENILEECYKEWPIPFPDLVEQLVKDTGLVAWVIDDWFVRKTDRCLRALFAQDDIWVRYKSLIIV